MALNVESNNCGTRGDDEHVVSSVSAEVLNKEKSGNCRQRTLKRRLKFPLCSLVVQIGLIVLLSKFTDYPHDAHAKRIRSCDVSRLASKNSVKNYSSLGFTLNFTNDKVLEECNIDEDGVNVFGPPYQDAQFFIVTGLTLLFLGVRHHSLSTMAFSIFVISICLQWSFICRGLIRLNSRLEPIKPSPDVFVITVFFAAAVLISWGIILGRVSPMQILVMCIIEIPVAIVNDYIILDVFKVSDPGGALIYNIFGTYYGLAVSRMIYIKGEKLNEDKRENTVYSETMAFLGSNILWGFWPTAMGAIFSKGVRLRCILNTYFALTGSGVMGTILGIALDPAGKLTASYAQNGVLAGAVAMSGAADTMMGIHAAVIVGCIAGSISVITSTYIQPFLAKNWHIVDTAGSHTLHGMPAVFGGIVSAVLSSLATEEEYGASLYVTFPAMAPQPNTKELMRVQALWPQVKPGDGRTAAIQAGYQLACMGITFVIAVCSGVITGWIMRHNFFDPLKEDDFYEDALLFNMPIGEIKTNKLYEGDTYSLKTNITTIKDEQKSNFSSNTQTNFDNSNEINSTSF